ncbi:MAG: rod shape-determining protein MreC [Lachnospiraceae bacterium]|nr:rod shape-determining protein MreC [Lachnospiraceae bacterium]
MSPVIKKKGEKFTLPSKYLLFILTIICSIMLVVTYVTDIFDKPLSYAVNYIIVPYQKGISAIGSRLSAKKDELVMIADLIEENEALKAKVSELEDENTRLMQDKYELNNLRALFELDAAYEGYKKTGARVIYHDASNWFSNFIINKGSEDGIELNMNVVAGNGLVGYVSMVGPNWSRVTSIISDNTNVSGTVLYSSENLIVSGSLELINQGVISYSQLLDSKETVGEGDKVVTSNISDKYLPGILIGYIQTIENDSNNLTKSGLLIPAVNFENIEEVLIILDQKMNITDKDIEEAEKLE